MSCSIPVPVGRFCMHCQSEHGAPRQKIGKTLVIVGIVGVIVLCGFLYYRYRSPYSMSYRGDYY